MPFSVSLIDEVGYERLKEKRATQLCATAFQTRGFEPDRLGEVSVVLVSSEVIRNLNDQFRSIDAPTDVLSFEVDGPHGEMVGEIVIAPECASTEMGIEELVIHGALHLGGMDHGDDFESSEMSEVQEMVSEIVRG
ncbi:rRNA maturation RNase YbeY [soil metagenome]